MFRKILDIWPVTVPADLGDDLLKGKSLDKLFLELSDHNSITSFVDCILTQKKIKIRAKLLPFLYRGIAKEIHEKGVRYIKSRSTSIKSKPKLLLNDCYIVLHPYIWWGIMADTIIAQG